MPEFDPALLLTIPLLLLGFGVLMAFAGIYRQLEIQRTRAEELHQQIELVRQSISGLTAGAVGMDRRMQQLEARERLLSERQETFEIQQADEQPYGQAIRLVQQGAGVGRLIQELDLSESEAELIVRMHGHRDIA